MSLFDYIYPPDCLSCGELLKHGRKFLCPRCQSSWEIGKRREINKQIHMEHPFHWRIGYRPDMPIAVENRLLLRFKYKADARIVDFLASEMAIFIAALDILPADGKAVLAWIPRREQNVKKHGYDHMARLAGRLSKQFSIPKQRLLTRTVDAAEQKRLSAKERWMNASKTIVLAPKADCAGKTVILLDDIATTGASLRAASDLLMGIGAREVICVSTAVAEHRQAESSG
ncbi:MAG: ComF family protein [Ruminococcaceae bacterium]|nr:ComF family protein [Oscillospiraceae bacterium]